MKGIKLFLITGLFLFALPLTSFADEYTNNPTGSKDVELYSEVASTYTVALPKRVDVTAETVTFDVTVKGDIAGDEKVSVTMANSAILKEVVGASGVSHNDIDLAISWANPDFNYDTIATLAGETRQASISHLGVVIPAGTWRVNYPITIALNARV